jgi:hypothetical protein
MGGHISGSYVRQPGVAAAGDRSRQCEPGVIGLRDFLIAAWPRSRAARFVFSLTVVVCW